MSALGELLPGTKSPPMPERSPAASAQAPVNVGGWMYQDADAAVEAAWNAFQLRIPGWNQ